MNYELLMNKCIKLAKLAEGETSPNPMVGCIVLDKQGNIISKAYHKKCGENHAEREALLKIDKSLSEGGTLIVNLEPCSHFGKTPPCVDLIIEKGIKKVVIGMKDVNPIVSGKGIDKLKNAGIEVIVGVSENNCKKLNEVFIKNIMEQKTFVAIKTATTIDGKVATYTGSSKWITSENARSEVLHIRKKYDAILTSAATIIADNPTMTHKNKIILDRELRTDFKNANIYKNGNCVVFYDKNSDAAHLNSVLNCIKHLQNIKLFPIKTDNHKIDLNELLTKLYELGVMSVLVEAGGRLNGSFLPFTDKIYQFIAPKIIGDNKALSCFDYKTAENINDAYKFNIENVEIFNPDILITYTRK